jgi:hypothetical protein
MKLHWFSPLPPAASEIANHTARVLPELRRAADVVLWSDRPGWDANLERWAPVRHYSPESMPWDELTDGAAVFNIGNDPTHHGAIWQVSQRQPGVVVLHDTHLQHMFMGLYNDGKLNSYLNLMSRHHGDAGAAAAADVLAGRVRFDDVAEQFPLTGLALDGASGVLVHTPGALAGVRNGYRPVALAHLPYSPGERRVGPPPGPPFRLIMFGYIGSNRRLESVLRALARYPSRDLIRFDVYGRLYDEARFREIANSPALRGRAVIHGFVEEPVLQEALASAHLAVNLRHPTMGEASASQLRIWEHALPSLVTPVGWYADQPADVAIPVRPDREDSDIHQALDGLMADPAHYRRVGEAGRRHLEERHQPRDYVEALLALAGRTRLHEGEVLARRLAGRLADRLKHWATGLPDLCARRLAPHLHRLARRN